MEDQLTTIIPRKAHAGHSRVRVGSRNYCESTPEIVVHKGCSDRIESIVITCTCGEEITVVCNYDG